MLQIRLSKGGGGSSGDGGVAGARSSSVVAVVETVTVACPDHLVLADLPVAKSLGAVTASAVRSVGRRSRRHLGERVHFCVRCDFPIAIYGRLMPCEHAFCLACARTDSSCYLCDERIQKIQTIKLMEGVYICAAPHCLKSFLKKAEFEAHVQETHADLLNPNEKDGANENNPTTKPSSIDGQKQSLQPEVSTARAPPKSGFSPSSNSQQQDWEERTRRHQSRDPSPRPPVPLKPPSFQSRLPAQSGDQQPENPPQDFDRPYNWFPQPPAGSPFHQNPDQFSSDKVTRAPSEPPIPNFIPAPNQPLNYPLQLNSSQTLLPTSQFPYSPFQGDGSHPYYALPAETARPDSAAEGGSEQASVGFPPTPIAMAGFSESSARPWGMNFMGLIPMQTIQMDQGTTESFGNPTDLQAAAAYFQGDFNRMPEGMPMNSLFPGKALEQQGGLAVDRNDGKGVLGGQSPMLSPPMHLPPPPPLPPPLSQQQQQQLNRSRDAPPGFGSPPGFGWSSDKRGPD